MQNKYLCPAGHVFFSTSTLPMKCYYCKLEAKIFVSIQTMHAKSAIEEVIYIKPPREKKRYYCECGKEKSEKAAQCSTCYGNSLKGKPINYSTDPIVQLAGKITKSKRNIERWEKMIEGYKKMNELNKEKKEK